MIEFDDELKKLVNFQKLGYVATVSSDGTPNLSPKGTIAILDDSRLVFANIRSPKTIENLTNNPSIEINVIDPFSRMGYRFKGLANILSNGEDFENILSCSIENSLDLDEISKAPLDDILIDLILYEDIKLVEASMRLIMANYYQRY